MNVPRFFIVFLIAALLSGLALWRADFSINKIQIPLLCEPDPRAPLNFEWPKNFRYLNQGAQIFAFESEDGKHVLKFFNRDQLKIPKFLSRKNKIRRKEKIRIYPESYRLAFENLPEETGLLAVHQGVSEERYPTVEVIDKASRKFSIDLNAVPFVLQKKGKGTLLGELDADKSKLLTFFDQFLAFHAKRISLRIADGDRDIKRNYCWIGDQFIYIDPARFFYEEDLRNPERMQLEWWKATYRLRQWLAKYAPEQLAAFDAKVEKYSVVENNI
jgi:hypothetical protein